MRTSSARQACTLEKAANPYDVQLGLYHVGTKVAAGHAVSSRETQQSSRKPGSFPCLGHVPLTFARNDLSQVVQAFAGSTIKGTRSGMFASTRAFSCKTEVLNEVRVATERERPVAL